jgi:hypothetical protein
MILRIRIAIRFTFRTMESRVWIRKNWTRFGSRSMIVLRLLIDYRTFVGISISFLERWSPEQLCECCSLICLEFEIGSMLQGSSQYPFLFDPDRWISSTARFVKWQNVSLLSGHRKSSEICAYLLQQNWVNESDGRHEIPYWRLLPCWWRLEIWMLDCVSWFQRKFSSYVGDKWQSLQGPFRNR